MRPCAPRCRMHPHVYLFILFYMVSCLLRGGHPRSSLWRLNADKSKVEAVPFRPVGLITDDDPVFSIIATTARTRGSPDHLWVKNNREGCTTTTSATKGKLPYNLLNDTSYKEDDFWPRDNANDESLDCGKPVNFTYYDTLVGVANRHRHPIAPEPHIALILGTRKRDKSIDYSVNVMERRLRKAKRDKPKSIQLYNQIGNFWRLKGDTEKAIECFRRALAVSPHNGEVLLNLGRVLYTLQYLDDAIYLTRRSLEMQTVESGAWQQYFTLGEIFKAYGRYQEATIHLQHTLQLKPDFEPAQFALNEMDKVPTASLHFYTLFIIISLVMACLFALVLTADFSTMDDGRQEMRTQRSFNKTMSSTFRGIRNNNNNNGRCRKLST